MFYFYILCHWISYISQAFTVVYSCVSSTASDTSRDRDLHSMYFAYIFEYTHRLLLLHDLLLTLFVFRLEPSVDFLITAQCFF